jgi:tetratricopeptide (TPR) repeat protein
MEAVQRAMTLAEKSGQLASLVGLMVSAGMSAIFASRDMAGILKLADQALELALREGSSGSLLIAHSLQMQARYSCRDLAGAEKHFAAEMEHTDDPTVRQNYGTILVQDLGIGAMNAWMLGLPDLARQRFAEMVAITNTNHPYQVALSRLWAADFHFALSEYDQAEACATQALELSEKHQFAALAALSKCALGGSRTALGRATEGAELLRGIAGLPEVRLARYFIFLAAAQERAGAIDDALEAIEQSLQVNPEVVSSRPEALRARAELRLKKGQAELAEARLPGLERDGTQYGREGMGAACDDEPRSRAFIEGQPRRGPPDAC